MPGSTGHAMKVHFFLPDEAPSKHLLGLDSDRDWQQMRRKQQWLLQTALRLRQAGDTVEVTNQVPTDGMVVYHSCHGKKLQRQLNGHGRPLLVGIRGDNRESLIADFEVVQNGRFHDGLRRFFVPYWPQPGLIPRSAERGSRVERVAFKGFEQNLHPYFRENEWAEWCDGQGIEWLMHSEEWKQSEVVGIQAPWHDYSDIDVVLALRPDATRAYQRRGHTSKPANKLINAWIAGVPAVLGREFAFREAGDPPNDYLEADNPTQVKEAILSLRRDPELFKRIVAAGRRKTPKYRVSTIVEQWRELLFQTLPRLAETTGNTWATRRRLETRAAARKVLRILSGRPAR